MTKDDNDEDRHRTTPITRLAMRFSEDEESSGERIPEIEITHQDNKRSIVRFKQATKGSGKGRINRTSGIFSEKQSPTWQAYSLLLWLVERRGKSYEKEDLPVKQLKSLRGWVKVRAQGSEWMALKRIVGNSQVIEREGVRAWIRSDVEVTIEGSEQDQAILLDWAGVPRKQLSTKKITTNALVSKETIDGSAPVTDAFGATHKLSEGEHFAEELSVLRFNIERALRPMQTVVVALAEKIHLLESSGDLVARLANAMVNTSGKLIASAFSEIDWHLEQKYRETWPRKFSGKGRAGTTYGIDAERGAVRDLLYQTLPLAPEWRALVLRARAAFDCGVKVIELPLRTETIAEVVLAGAERRSCQFVLGEFLPQGITRIPLPTTARKHYRNEDGDLLVKAVIRNFCREDKDGGEYQQLWRRFRKYPDLKFIFRQTLEAHEKQRHSGCPPHYFLHIDKDVGGDDEDLGKLWTVAKRAFGEALPSLRLIRLTGGIEVLDEEFDVAYNIRQIHNRLSQRGA